jgi:hypothetical protein
MPRSHLPRLAKEPKAVPFKLGDDDKKKIAPTLGAENLSAQITELIEWNVTSLRATQAGSKDCTVANTRFVLQQLEKQGRARRDALEVLGHGRAAVDDTTLEAIQPLAKAVLADKRRTDQTLEALLNAARQRDAELGQHPRVVPTSEPFRFFCGVLRRIFFTYSTVHQNEPAEKVWHLCRCFALAVFDAAQIEHHDFLARPKRLTEYLQTDVTIT